MTSATKTKSNNLPSSEHARKDGPVVTKVGNLCADPELRFASSGKAYPRMRIAVSVPVTPGDWAGERETVYYDVTAFGSLAENASESLNKGARVVVTGRGEVRSWTGEDGTEHQGKAIVADALGPDLRFVTVEVHHAHRDEEATAFSGDEEPF